LGAGASADMNRPEFVGCTLFFLLLAGCVAHAEVRFLDVAKSRWAVQTQSGTCSLAPGSPWVFEADIVTARESDLVGTPTLSSMAGTREFTMPLPYNGMYYRAQLEFDTETAMDSLCGTGDYVFTFQRSTSDSATQVRYFLSGSYPPFPYLVGGDWQDGRLVVDPTVSTFFRWCQPPRRDNLQVVFHVADGTGNIIGPIYDKQDFTSFGVKPNELAAGRSYTVFVTFFYLVDAPAANGRGGACMQSITRIEMLTLPSPTH
jgi:hypothetical protein